MEIVATLGPIWPTSSRLAEKIFEDIVKDVPESAAIEIEPVKAWPTLLCPGMTEHVVAFPLFLIAQRFVGFVDLFEFFFGCFFLLIASMEIWMVLTRELSIGFFKIVVGYASIDAESFVVVAF